MLVAVVLAGCGGTGGGGESGTTPSPTPSATLPDDPTPTLPDDPTPTGKPSAGLQSVTGVVERSPEDRCVTLAATGRTWVLTGTGGGPGGPAPARPRGRAPPAG